MVSKGALVCIVAIVSSHTHSSALSDGNLNTYTHAHTQPRFPGHRHSVRHKHFGTCAHTRTPHVCVHATL